MQTPAQGQGQTACGSTQWALRNSPAKRRRSAEARGRWGSDVTTSVPREPCGFLFEQESSGG